MGLTIGAGSVADCPIEDMPLCENITPGKCYKLTTKRWVFSLVIARRRSQ